MVSRVSQGMVNNPSDRCMTSQKVLPMSSHTRYPCVRSVHAPKEKEPISTLDTCATEARWDAVRGGEPEGICRYFEGSRQRNAPRSPRPSGLRPGRASASLPALTISTYGLRRPPSIHPALATTHHASRLEIGSNQRKGIPGSPPLPRTLVAVPCAARPARRPAQLTYHLLSEYMVVDGSLVT